MRLKIKLILWILVAVQLCKANMSSPILEGTLAGSAFSSKDVVVLSELIKVKIDSVFKTARFTVEYTIKSDVSGQQIPLLFYAEDFKDSFLVWLDNKMITIQNIPEEYIHGNQGPFSNFSNSMQESDEITIYWVKDIGYSYKLNDLKYFEADIQKGIHSIRVEYTANVWTDLSGWVKEYSFRYSLTPARFWKSFGTLKIVVEQTGAITNYTTNLGKSAENKIQRINSWRFGKLPAEYFEITYVPPIDDFAKAAIYISPFGFLLIFGVVLLLIHLWVSYQYRKRNVNKKYSIVVIVGSLLVPFLILFSYIYAYELIDRIIGEEAARHHGYVFLIMVLYPIFLPVYWIIMWLIDKFQKRRLRLGYNS